MSAGTSKPKLVIPDWESHDIKAIIKANPDIKIREIPFMIKQFKIR